MSKIFVADSVSCHDPDNGISPNPSPIPRGRQGVQGVPIPRGRIPRGRQGVAPKQGSLWRTRLRISSRQQLEERKRKTDAPMTRVPTGTHTSFRGAQGCRHDIGKGPQLPSETHSPLERSSTCLKEGSLLLQAPVIKARVYFPASEMKCIHAAKHAPQPSAMQACMLVLA